MIQAPIFACMNALLVLVTPSLQCKLQYYNTTPPIYTTPVHKSERDLLETTEVDDWIKQKKKDLIVRREVRLYLKINIYFYECILFFIIL